MFLILTIINIPGCFAGLYVLIDYMLNYETPRAWRNFSIVFGGGLCASFIYQFYALYTPNQNWVFKIATLCWIAASFYWVKAMKATEGGKKINKVINITDHGKQRQSL